MKIKNRIRAGIVLLALALGLTACGGSSSSTASSAASSAPASSVSESVSAEPESTSAAPESAVNTEASPLDGIKFSVSKVRNDNTGNWRISLIAENIDMSEYALDYYKQYFTDDSKIHFIVNFNYNTTTKIMVMGGDLDVTVQEYVAKEEHDANLGECVDKLQKKIVRRWLANGKRVDGRGMEEVRPLAAEVHVLPRVHGSGMFTRGQTQVLTLCTLGTLGDAQELDTIFEEKEKRYIHHYNFPSFSVGETRPSRGPGRREIGHGALAERALLPVIPPVSEFPYALRLVSEVISSNGSTSQGSVCGSTLALMDAGVPIKAPVAGISCGLITDGGQETTFTDIQGVEDFYGDMDFKVAGTKKGITAIQVDIKVDGLTPNIIKQAFEKCRVARYGILDEIMLKAIPQPREDVSDWAPKMTTMHINPDKIREVIGKGGSVIQNIVAESGAKVDIEDDGTVTIAAVKATDADKAKKMIEAIVKDPEPGEVYYGKVVRILPIGAFVELAPGKDGMIHISKLENRRVEKVEDVLNIGDMTWVKVTEIDEKGRWNLSRKDALIEIEAQQAAAKAAEQQ